MKIAVLIPCFNEELTIGKVIQDFRSVLPHSNIYVFDNNSTDKTADAEFARLMIPAVPFIIFSFFRVTLFISESISDYFKNRHTLVI